MIETLMTCGEIFQRAIEAIRINVTMSFIKPGIINSRNLNTQKIPGLACQQLFELVKVAKSFEVPSK